MMQFNSEKKFEDALIENLINHGWTGVSWLNNGNPVLEYPSEEDLVNNWCDILENNNSHTLNNLPLIPEEREMLRQQVAEISSPYNANEYINNVVCIDRLNKDDVLNYHRPVYLTLYDKSNIAGGSSIYQIARQPIFKRHQERPLSRDRRGDIMLLINGLPLIHIELKKSGVPLSEAYYQIDKYIKEGKFKNNFFTLIQMFVAMNPEDCLYFANCEPGKFNEKFLFHWADKNNKIINKWQDISKTFLSIPLAHKMVSYYTIADSADTSLKVMRSYQCHAVNEIYKKALRLWDSNDHVHGGYCYHCTGSGKTMTSYKAAERLSGISGIDKVVFLVDRSDLNEQSVNEFQNFADDRNDVDDAKNTYNLYEKLNNKSEKIIVCTIQKLNHLCESDRNKYVDFCEKAEKLRCVFITDECHRSQFGDMCKNIRDVFTDSAFFGFTGTPIYDENSKYGLKTSDIFGDVLSVYSIADGIRNEDVLAFDTEWVDLIDRKELALEILRRKHNCDANNIYSDHMDEFDQLMNMDGYDFEKKYVTKEMCERIATKEEIVDDIIKEFPRVSLGKKYHAIFATTSIKSACTYYKLFKAKAPELKVTTVFSLNDEGSEEELIMEKEILPDYNKRFKQHFDMADISGFEKNVATRLAHKKEMKNITPENQLDIVIVVDKMLTGYDSKYVNTLFLDKELKNEALIQAFSRTNRVFKPDKKHGIIRLYRKPYTMKENLDKALKLYADADKNDMFVNKIYSNVCDINEQLDHIKELFTNDQGKLDFSKLPEDNTKRQDFVNTFNKLQDTIHAANLQGLDFNKKEYVSEDDPSKVVILELDNDIYEILKVRYDDVDRTQDGESLGDDNIIYNISYDITENRIRIDKEYINKYFNQYMCAKNDNSDDEIIEKIKDELVKSFAKLCREEQDIAEDIMDDIDNDTFVIKDGYGFFDYLNDYINVKNDNHCREIADVLCIDYETLRDLKIKADNAGNPSVSFNKEPHSTIKRQIKGDDVLDKFEKRIDVYAAYLEGDTVREKNALDKYK